MSPAQATPLTVSLKLIAHSKHAVSMMHRLALKTPPKNIKLDQDDGNKVSLCDTVDFDDPMMIK